MGEDQIKNAKMQDKDKNKRTDEKLTPCTTAPSAEQARAHDDSEPCDDSREGHV
jgi:hypothetical protein